MDLTSPEAFHLSPQQRRLWALQQSRYDLPFRAWCAVEVAGRVEPAMVARALTRAVARHEILGTTLKRLAALRLPLQLVRSKRSPQLLVGDLSALPEAGRETAVGLATRRFLARPLDCEEGPTLSALWLRRAPDRSLLLLCLPALCADGITLRNLVREVADHLAAPASPESGSATPEAAPDTVQYADFAAWQNEQLEAADTEEGRKFWRRHDSLAATQVMLPLAERIAEGSSFAPRPLRLTLEPAIAGALAALAARLRAEVSNVLLAAWQAVLWRGAGGSKIVVATAYGGRRHEELESSLGLFARYLPVASSAAAAMTFSELVEQTARGVAALEDWQEHFSWELYEGAAAAEGARFFPFAFDFHDLWPTVAHDGLCLSLLDADACSERFQVRLCCRLRAGVVELDLHYDSSVVPTAAAACLLDQLQTLISSALARPEARLEELEMTSSAWRRRLLVEWCATTVDLGADRCLHDLVAAQAAQTPGSVAVVAGERTLCYAELEASANQLAHHLRRLGAAPEQRVAVLLERSLPMVTAILGILRSGAAYLPLDAALPRARLEHMLAAANCKLVVTVQALAPRLQAVDPRIVCLDSEAPDIAAQPRQAPASGVRPENLAYVIFTSGSTGTPKGVMVSHAAIANRLLWMQRVLPIGKADVVLQKTPISFDASIWELFMPLLAGGRLLLAEPGGHQDGEYLAATVAQHGITVLQLVPSFLRAFLDTGAAARCGGLRRLFCGGEALASDLVEQCRSLLGAEIHNLYGPTEAAIDAAHWPCHERSPQPVVPIGRPLDNVTIHLLDGAFRPVPVGCPGEIHIGGAGLARGYVNRPDLTAASFLPNPFATAPGSLLYATGDQARWRPDGVLDFLGRRDQQVKIRGVRVEIEEIEAVLRGCPGVADLLVAAREDRRGERRLVAYVVTHGDQPPTVDELRQWSRLHLPDAMQPAAWMRLDALPRTASGKLDRAAAPAPGRPMQAEVPFVAPRGPVEEGLAGVWSGVLQVERVSVHDNFFALGGDSILSLQILSRAARLGIRLTAKQMFQFQTIAEQATVASITQAGAMAQGPVTGRVSLTPIQRRFFALQLRHPHHWNQAVLLASRVPLDAARLAAAIALLLTHHDALRLRFELAATPGQLLGPPGGPPPFQVVDLAHLAEPLRGAALQAAAGHAQRSLHLETGPLFRAVLFRAAPAPDRLLMVGHHLAVDGVSWRILLRDLETAYRNAGGEAVDLPPKTTSFQQWAAQLERYARRDELLGELPYWLQATAAETALPLDAPAVIGSNREGSARTVEVELDEQETHTLLRVAPRGYRLQVAEILLTALLRACRPWTGRRELAVELEGHGREDLFEEVDLSRTVGWFTCLYPVRLELPATDDPGAQLKAVKEQLRRVPQRGIGYGLLRYSTDTPPTRELARRPVPEVSFNYLGQFDSLLGELSLFEPAGEPGGANRDPGARRAYRLEVNGGISKAKLRLSFGYSSDLHQRATIERLAAGFLAELQLLLLHCQSPQAHGYTPADFPLAALDETALAKAIGSREDVEDLYPLSPLQRGLLAETLQHQGSGIYFQQLSCTLHGPLDVELFARAWQLVVDRHPTLRSGFLWEGLQQPLQVVSRHAPLVITQLDWRRLGPGERSARLQDLLHRESVRGFDLALAPLMRVYLIAVAAGEHELVWSHHHLILDGWSVPILVREVFAYYEAARRGEVIQLPPPRPYRDFIAWLARQDLTAAEAFWRQQLRGFRSRTPLGIDRPDSVPGSGRGRYAETGLRLAEAVTEELRQFTQRHQLTLSSLLQGVWAALLGRYSGEAEVLFGAVSAGRPAALQGVETMLGLFINTLPVRVAMPDREATVEWLQALQRQQVEARQHEVTPLADIQGYSELHRGMPMFESLLVFENYPIRDLVEEQAQASVRIASVRFEDRNSYPLSVLVGPGAQLSLRVAFDQARIDRPTAHRILGHLTMLLRQMTANPETPIAEISLLSAVERHQVASEWNATAAPAADGRSLHGMVEAQAARTPEAIALLAGERRLTYGELDRTANRIARQLRDLGVRPEVPVGIFLRRSPVMVASLLGVLKAGGAYLPLDPEYPASRVELMLEDSRAAVVLVERSLRARLPATTARLLEVDPLAEPAAAGEAEPVEPAAVPPRLAYLIYTSGSTGRPKGVEIEHRSAVALMDWAAAAFSPAELAGVLAGSSISFDLSVFEIFAPLTRGGTVILADSTLALPTLPGAPLVTFVNTVPTVLAALLRQRALPAGVRVVATAGETLPQTVAQEVYRETAIEALYNLYGPTEDTTYSTWIRVERQLSRPPSIGRPFPNTRVHLLDRRLGPVPPGVAGEIYLAGDGLARGYLRRPELTAERFLPDPFDGRGARMYKTGDLARWLPDGALDFIARTDHQVKVRGHRIELGEIEAVLQEHPGVADAVAMTHQETAGERTLVAFFTARGETGPTPQELRAFARLRLPEPMVPGRLIAVAEIPRSANGKADRQALAALAGDRQAPIGAGHVEPRNPLEEVLAAMWAELLRRDRIGVDDDFFELGGDSLLAVQLMSRLRETFSSELPASALFSSSTVALLAQALETHEPRPGETAKTALALKRLRALSPEERDRLLAARGAAAAAERVR